MSIIDFPRLCGGTVFILLLAARGQRTAKRDNANGKTDGLSQPELLIELSRSESDRYGWFISDSSIRASLELARFYEIEIPLPSLEKQQAVVNFYNARHLIMKNITTVGNMLKELCPILIKGSLEEASA